MARNPSEPAGWRWFSRKTGEDLTDVWKEVPSRPGNAEQARKNRERKADEQGREYIRRREDEE